MSSTTENAPKALAEYRMAKGRREDQADDGGKSLAGEALEQILNDLGNEEDAQHHADGKGNQQQAVMHHTAKVAVLEHGHGAR